MNENAILSLYNRPKNKQILPKQNIVKVCSEINYTKFYLSDGRSIIIARTLSTFEPLLLQNDEFIRPNKGHIINSSFIKGFFFSGQTGNIILLDDTVIKISRRRLKSLREQISK